MNCAWCGAPFTPNRIGRPRVYCSEACRRAAGHHREDLRAGTPQPIPSGLSRKEYGQRIRRAHERGEPVELGARICPVPECGRERGGHRYCTQHYFQRRRAQRRSSYHQRRQPPEPIPARPCAQCNQPYVPRDRHPGRRFCSPQCRKRWQYTHPTAARIEYEKHRPRRGWSTCRTCGLRFRPQQLRYCSDTCRPIRVQPQPKPPRPPRACRICNQAIPASEHVASKYCSAVCRLEGNRLASRRRHPRRSTWIPKELQCLACGTSFLQKAPNHLFCDTYGRRRDGQSRCARRFDKTRSLIIGGTGLSLNDLPTSLLDFLRTYRELNLWRNRQQHGSQGARAASETRPNEHG